MMATPTVDAIRDADERRAGQRERIVGDDGRRRRTRGEIDASGVHLERIVIAAGPWVQRGAAAGSGARANEASGAPARA
jgi:hypothetical protein